jgi:hypothetical protein
MAEQKRVEVLSNPFLSKLSNSQINLNLGKVAQKCGLLLYLSKTSQMKQSTKGRKFAQSRHPGRFFNMLQNKLCFKLDLFKIEKIYLPALIPVKHNK